MTQVEGDHTPASTPEQPL